MPRRLPGVQGTQELQGAKQAATEVTAVREARSTYATPGFFRRRYPCVSPPAAMVAGVAPVGTLPTMEALRAAPPLSLTRKQAMTRSDPGESFVASPGSPK